MHLNRCVFSVVLLPQLPTYGRQTIQRNERLKLSTQMFIIISFVPSRVCVSSPFIQPATDLIFGSSETITVPLFLLLPFFHERGKINIRNMKICLTKIVCRVRVLNVLCIVLIVATDRDVFIII